MVVICSINIFHFFDYNDATERGSMKNYAIGLYEKAIPKEMSWKEKLECAVMIIWKSVLMRRRRNLPVWTGPTEKEERCFVVCKTAVYR